MTFGPLRHLATLSELRERDLYIFGNTLVNIAMSHPLSNLRVRTLTINSGDVPPLLNMFGHVPPVNQTLSDMTSFGNVLLLFIAMTHAGCGLKLCNVALSSGDVFSLPP